MANMRNLTIAKLEIKQLLRDYPCGLRQVAIRSLLPDRARTLISDALVALVNEQQLRARNDGVYLLLPTASMPTIDETLDGGEEFRPATPPKELVVSRHKSQGEVFALLAQRPMSTRELADALGKSVQQVSSLTSYYRKTGAIEAIGKRFDPLVGKTVRIYALAGERPVCRECGKPFGDD